MYACVLQPPARLNASPEVTPRFPARDRASAHLLVATTNPLADIETPDKREGSMGSPGSSPTAHRDADAASTKMRSMRSVTPLRRMVPSDAPTACTSLQPQSETLSRTFDMSYDSSASLRRVDLHCSPMHADAHAHVHARITGGAPPEGSTARNGAAAPADKALGAALKSASFKQPHPQTPQESTLPTRLSSRVAPDHCDIAADIACKSREANEQPETIEVGGPTLDQMLAFDANANASHASAELAARKAKVPMHPLGIHGDSGSGLGGSNTGMPPRSPGAATPTQPDTPVRSAQLLGVPQAQASCYAADEKR